MKITISSIDESENKKELDEWLSLPSQGYSLTTEWDTCEVEVSDGVKITANASLTNDSSNLSLSVVEDGDKLFEGHFSLNGAAMVKFKSKTGCWLEFIAVLDHLPD